MDDADLGRLILRDPAVAAAEKEKEILYFLEAWRNWQAEEQASDVTSGTRSPGDTVAHARRCLGGIAAGHWCDLHPNQREAVKRFLAEQDSKIPPKPPAPGAP